MYTGEQSGGGVIGAGDELGGQEIVSVCTQPTTNNVLGAAVCTIYIQYEKMNSTTFFHGDWVSRSGMRVGGEGQGLLDNDRSIDRLIDRCFCYDNRQTSRLLFLYPEISDLSLEVNSET